MTNRRLQFFLVATMGTLSLIGCNRTPSQSQMTQELSDFPYSQLKTAADVERAVEEATSNANVILLVHVSWAPMVQQRSRFAEFKRDFGLQHPDNDLEFRYIDCTPITSGYEPLRSLEGWIELEQKNNGTSLVHGYGELAWCKNGRVLHVERPLDFDSTDALIAKTVELGMANVAK